MPLTGGLTVRASELCLQIVAIRPIARIAIRATGISPLPYGPGQLHCEPVVSLGREMNMVGLQHAWLMHNRLHGPECIDYPDAATR